MRSPLTRRVLAIPVALCALLAGGAVRVAQDTCGPFTDVSPSICPFVLEMYYLGITAGTSPTTFSPDNPMTRGQAAVFVSKGINQVLARSSRRAALGHWWTTTPNWDIGLGTTGVGQAPSAAASDGADIWVANQGDGTVSRVRASDGRLLETWTGATGANGVLVAMGRVFVLGLTNPGKLYMIDPSMPPGAVITATSALASPFGMAFDGARIWVSDNVGPITIITPGPSLPWSTTTIQPTVVNPRGVVFDGKNIWMTDGSSPFLVKFDAAGNVIQQVQIGFGLYPVFDGTNIWVPNHSTVAVVSASTGTVVQTFTGGSPLSAAFDGERVLVTNDLNDSVPLWRAADLLPLGTFSTGAGSVPYGSCSNGINFWIALSGSNQLGRF